MDEAIQPKENRVKMFFMRLWWWYKEKGRVSNYLIHAEREFEIAGWKKKGVDESQGWVMDNVRGLLKEFSTHGHSGTSAPYVLNLFNKLAKFEIIKPLTFEDSEWNDMSEMNGKEYYQNNRLSSVFKDGKNAKPHYIHAIVWQGEDDYDSFSGTVEGIGCAHYIRKPFKPKTFRIDVRRELYNKEKHGDDSRAISCGTGDYVYFIKDKEKLKETFKYYDKMGKTK